MFTGQNHTVSFWKCDTKYFLFNLHAVSSSGTYDPHTPTDNYARIFECDDMPALCEMLLSHVATDDIRRFYIAHRFQIVAAAEDIPNTRNLTITSSEDVQDNDSENKLVMSTPRKCSRGPPKKSNCERPRQSKNLKKNNYKMLHNITERYTLNYIELQLKDTLKTSRNKSSCSSNILTKNHPEVNKTVVRRRSTSFPRRHLPAEFFQEIKIGEYELAI